MTLRQGWQCQVTEKHVRNADLVSLLYSSECNTRTPHYAPRLDLVYYEVLTGERKSAEGLVAQGVETLKNRKKMAELGFEEGLGFIPYADIGYSAAKAVRKDDTSPVRAAAARVLVNDPDPRIGQALVCAASDKSWIVRASALLAIAKQGHPELVNAIIPAMTDKNEVVRYTAAAAVIRLTTAAERNKI